MPKPTTKKPVKSAAGIDLAKLFGAVATSLAENRDGLNQADTYNNDHGDNMVQIFQTVAKVMGKSKSADQSKQLASASAALQKSKSGSAQFYANSLSQASKQFKGQTITPDNAMGLLQALMGSTGSLPATSQTPQPGGDLLGSLLGSMSGGGTTESANPDGLDLGDVLNAGMAFMNAKQQGKDTTEALIGALISASPLGQSSHRSQSGALVASTIMQVIGGLAKK